MAVRVTAVTDTDVITKVEVPGYVSNHKGLNLPGVAVSVPALSEKDREDLRWALTRADADVIALSFVRSASDIDDVHAIMDEVGVRLPVIAKIEKPQAVDKLFEIVSAFDGIMVARGDLAVEVGDAAVPALQKRMIRMAKSLNKVAITATQMMESMIEAPVPTRAEISDVANAVLDGTDAIILSAETATGKYPVETVTAMAAACTKADRADRSHTLDAAFLDRTFTRIDQSIAMAVLFAVHHMRASAIVSLTQSGSTAL